MSWENVSRLSDPEALWPVESRIPAALPFGFFLSDMAAENSTAYLV